MTLISTICDPADGCENLLSNKYSYLTTQLVLELSYNVSCNDMVSSSRSILTWTENFPFFKQLYTSNELFKKYPHIKRNEIVPKWTGSSKAHIELQHSGNEERRGFPRDSANNVDLFCIIKPLLLGIGFVYMPSNGMNVYRQQIQ